MSEIEDRKAKAIEDGEKACKAAYECTPPKYHQFITLIGQNKRVGGDRKNPEYASVRYPYIAVDGRVQMARDDHKESEGAILDVWTEFVEVAGQLLCKATVKSSTLGTAIGHARVFLGGTGVDSSNPLENGETSAIGRALGFLGYGLLGKGIASAEEVMRAMEAQEEVTQAPRKAGMVIEAVLDEKGTWTGDMRKGEAAREPDDIPEPPKRPASGGRPMSDKQRGLILALLSEAGVQEGDKRALLERLQIDDMREASRTIEALKAFEDDPMLPSQILTPYVEMYMQRFAITPEDIKDYCEQYNNGKTLSQLNPLEQRSLIGWLTMTKELEPEEEAAF